MTLNAQESEAFNALQNRVNELAVRMQEQEIAGKSWYDFLPRFIRDRISEWPEPIYVTPLRLLFDSTPQRKQVWEDDSQGSTNKGTLPGYHRGRPDGNEGKLPWTG